MSQPETEIYTYTQKQIFEGKTEIDMSSLIIILTNLFVKILSIN